MSEPVIYALCSRQTLIDMMENYYESTEGKVIVVPEDFWYAIWFVGKEVARLYPETPGMPVHLGQLFWRDKEVIRATIDPDTSAK